MGFFSQQDQRQKIWYAWVRINGVQREVTVLAAHMHVAKEMLEAQYGKQNVESNPYTR